MIKAHIVIGLGFGDEGKGVTVDTLCARANNPVVIRFSGGQQAGHTVILNGKKHVHSNFGSGALRGIPTYFTEHCLAYPVAAFAESERLKNKIGYSPALIYHPLVSITTPYDVLYNRAQYNASTSKGSCGMGIDATRQREMVGQKLFAVDLFNSTTLAIKMELIRSHYIKKNFSYHPDLKKELENFDVAVKAGFYTIAGYEFLGKYETGIFEGSQGVMLDQDHGFFPHVTHAHTTSKNAIEVCDNLNVYPDLFYVTRCYQTRHGHGPMTNNISVKLINNYEEVNMPNPFQGALRTAELDYNQLTYALTVDKIYSGRRPKTLVVTCLDQRPGYKFNEAPFPFIRNFVYHDSPSSDTLLAKAQVLSS